jgi:hypothetical protein
LLVSLVFLLIFLILLAVFMPVFLTEVPRLTILNMFLALIVAGFLMAILNSPNVQFFDYFRTFPLLEAELGLGWNSDSAFHATIIHSFNLFGFPSIGQHDTPLLVYHVLSHFVDAVVVKVTGIDVWQSYGLFYFFKSLLLLSAILFFIASVTLNKKLYIFLLSLVFLTPVVVATWHAIGSHGLWFTSLLVILSAPLVYKVISKNNPLRTVDYFILFSLFVAVSLGKVSSGFMYAALVGFLLLITHYKDARVYVFGIALLVFFVMFSSFITGSGSAFVVPGILDLWGFIALKQNPSFGQLGQIYLLILIIGITAWLFKSLVAIRLLAASVLSVLTLAVIVAMQPNFSGSDVWYFTFGLSSVLMMLAYQLIVAALGAYKFRYFEGMIYIDYPIIKCTLIVMLLAATSKFNSTGYSFFNAGFESTKNVLKNVSSQQFRQLNGYDNELKVDIFKQIADRKYINFNKYSRPLSEFKAGLQEFMRANRLSARNTLVYMPREIFESSMARFGGAEWARGMLLYAVTGVPLLHGIESLRATYGYSDYDGESLWVERKDFDVNVACQSEKNIVIVESFTDKVFNLVACR